MALNQGRQRGDHSTQCKCSTPSYFRSPDFKKLPGELGRAYHNLVGYQAQGTPYLKRRVSRDIFFVQFRHLGKRCRDFRPERRNLIDALWPLLISKLDLATGLVTVCLSALAKALSPVDAHGNPIPEQAVTPSRISRLVDTLVKYGLLELQPLGWDTKRKMFLPKYVALTEQGWKLTRCNIDKLYQEQQQRLQDIAGQSPPQTQFQARREWLAKKRVSVLIRRNQAISASKRVARLIPLSLEERKHDIASWLSKKLPFKQRISGNFISLIWQELRRMGLASSSPPDTK